MDTSLARVVLGDAPTYSASRNRAVLRPTAWSANQVIAQVYTARFASGSQAYLFVIDADNVPSSGYPVTIGQGQAVPNAPTDLTVN